MYPSIYGLFFFDSTEYFLDCFSGLFVTISLMLVLFSNCLKMVGTGEDPKPRGTSGNPGGRGTGTSCSTKVRTAKASFNRGALLLAFVATVVLYRVINAWGSWVFNSSDLPLETGRTSRAEFYISATLTKKNRTKPIKQ